MMNNKSSKLKKQSKKGRPRRVWHRAVFALVCAVVLCTAYIPILPASAMANTNYYNIAEADSFSVTIRQQDEDGNWNTAADTLDPFANSSVSLNFLVARNDISDCVTEVNGTKYYALEYVFPNELDLSSVVGNSGTFTVTSDNSTALAYWNIVQNEDGTYSVLFYIDYDEAGSNWRVLSGTFSTEFIFDYDSLEWDDDGDVIEFGGTGNSYTVDTTDYSGMAVVSKTAAAFDSENNTITYTVTVTTDGTIYNFSFEDTLSKYLDASTLTVNPQTVTVNGVTYTITPTTAENSDGTATVSFAVTSNQSGDNTSLNGIFEFTYTVAVNGDALSSGANIVDNGIEISFAPSADVDPKPSGSDTASTTVTYTPFTKSGSGANTDSGYTLTWTITLNNDGYDISGKTYTDTLDLSAFSLSLAELSDYAAQIQSQISAVVGSDGTVTASANADGTISVIIQMADGKNDKTYTIPYSITITEDMLNDLPDTSIPAKNTLDDVDDENTDPVVDMEYVPNVKVTKAMDGSDVVNGKSNQTIHCTVNLSGVISGGDTFTDNLRVNNQTDGSLGSIDMSSMKLTIGGTEYAVTGAGSAWAVIDANGKTIANITAVTDSSGNITGYTLTFTEDAAGTVIITYDVIADASDVEGNRVWQNTAEWKKQTTNASYSVKERKVEWQPRAYKTLKGADLENAAYGFTITETDSDWNAKTDDANITVGSNDTFTLGGVTYTISYTAWGSYVISGSNGDYIATSSAFTLGGKEYMVSGKTGEFYISTVSATIYNWYGSAGFPTYTYTEEGIWYYVIREEIPADGDADTNITYDDSVYHVTVEVKTNSSGELYKEVTIIKITTAADGTTSAQPADSISFTNVYSQTQEGNASLTKSGKLNDDGTITWTITAETLTDLFGDGTTADITDCLPAALKVTDITAQPVAIMEYWTASDSNGVKNIPLNGTTVNCTKIWSSQEAFSVSASTADNEDSGGTDIIFTLTRLNDDLTFTSGNETVELSVVLTITTEIADKDALEWTDGSDGYLYSTVSNSVKAGGSKPTTAEVTVSTRVLSKYGEAASEINANTLLTVDYTIEVNPDAIELNTGDDAYVTLYDTYAYNAVLLLETLQIVNADTKEALTYVENLENMTDSTWSYDEVYNHDDGEKTLYLYVPNSTALTVSYALRYSAYQEDNSSAYGGYTFGDTNTVSLKYYSTGTSCGDKNGFTQQNTEASAATYNFYLYIYKYDTEGEYDSYLNGAVFTFYKYCESEADWNYNVQDKYRAYDGPGFYHTVDRTVGEYVTGLVRFGTQADLQLNKLYYWQEISAPTGYKLNDTIHYFAFYQESTAYPTMADFQKHIAYLLQEQFSLTAQNEGDIDWTDTSWAAALAWVQANIDIYNVGSSSQGIFYYTENGVQGFANEPGATWAPRAAKTLIGGTLNAGAYSFTLTQTDESWAALADGYTQTVFNDSFGGVTFTNISYTEIGTYYYTITEDIPENATKNKDGTYTLGDVTYDISEYRCTITVTQDPSGNPVVSEKIIKVVNGSSESVTKVKFVNSIENDATLPRAGSFGTALFTVCGLLLMTGGGYYMLRRRKAEQFDRNENKAF